MVSPFSETAVARVLSPTGPPLNLSISVVRILLSISSKPCASTCKAFNPIWVMFRLMVPSPLICAKSRIRRKSALAIRGVPRLLLAISMAALSAMGMFKIWALLVTIPASTSVE